MFLEMISGMVKTQALPAWAKTRRFADASAASLARLRMDVSCCARPLESSKSGEVCLMVPMRSDSNVQGRHASDRELRAALWVIGHVGASADGWAVLNDTVGDVMKTISQMATSSPVLSMRGTCLYIVGMLGTTAAAREHLVKLKWARADERSVAMPDAINSDSRAPQLFSVQPLVYAGSWARQCATGARTPADTTVMERNDECVRREQLTIEEGEKVKVLLAHAADMQNTVMLQEGKAGLLGLKNAAIVHEANCAGAV